MRFIVILGSLLCAASSARAATVALNSFPAGADLVVDGAPAGTTPKEVQLPPGRHTVVFSVAASGWTSVTRTITLVKGEHASLEVALLPELTQGPRGLPGKDGAQGPRGAPGRDGPQGPQGPAGAIGLFWGNGYLPIPIFDANPDVSDNNFFWLSDLVSVGIGHQDAAGNWWRVMHPVSGSLSLVEARHTEGAPLYYARPDCDDGGGKYGPYLDATLMPARNLVTWLSDPSGRMAAALELPTAGGHFVAHGAPKPLSVASIYFTRHPAHCANTDHPFTRDVYSLVELDYLGSSPPPEQPTPGMDLSTARQ
ncbi:MAG: PEGA domain-containing protein [Deltaproteobacteria bacterium]|nr:PEGA domain-containing protein [Deltaproteobacteria bacterium]